MNDPPRPDASSDNGYVIGTILRPSYALGSDAWMWSIAADCLAGGPHYKTDRGNASSLEEAKAKLAAAWREGVTYRGVDEASYVPAHAMRLSDDDRRRLRLPVD